MPPSNSHQHKRRRSISRSKSRSSSRSRSRSRSRHKDKHKQQKQTHRRKKHHHHPRDHEDDNPSSSSASPLSPASLSICRNLISRLLSVHGVDAQQLLFLLWCLDRREAVTIPPSLNSQTIELIETMMITIGAEQVGKHWENRKRTNTQQSLIDQLQPLIVIKHPSLSACASVSPSSSAQSVLSSSVSSSSAPSAVSHTHGVTKPAQQFSVSDDDSFVPLQMNEMNEQERQAMEQLRTARQQALNTQKIINQMKSNSEGSTPQHDGWMNNTTQMDGSWTQSPREREMQLIQQQAYQQTRSAEEYALQIKEQRERQQMQATDNTHTRMSANSSAAAAEAASGKAVGVSVTVSTGPSLLEIHHSMRNTNSGHKHNRGEPIFWDRDKEMGLRRQKSSDAIQSEIRSASGLFARFEAAG